MKWKCIIVDDHALFNDGLNLILKESESFEVIEQIYDSRNAYHKCLKHLPDLVLVDYNMPHLNGIDVVKQLQTMQHQIKIVVISMYAERNEIVDFENLGVDGFISKTTFGADLIQKLDSIMTGKRYFELKKKATDEQTDDFFRIKSKLTKREIEVLKLLKEDYTTQEMADILNLSYYTVETHRKHINQKLKFGTKQELYDFMSNI